MSIAQTNVSVDVCQCLMVLTLLNWAYLPCCGNTRNRKMESEREQERGGGKGEKANKDRFCTMIGKKKQL